jgi:hypothetical protein
MAEDAWPAIGPAQIDALLAFLPLFEQKGYVFGQWERREGTLGWYRLSEGANRFRRVLGRQGFIRPFDWPAWAAANGRKYADDPAALASTDLDTLCKLLTWHVRADRFVEGNFGAALESGHVTAILRRLRDIRAGMQVSASPDN